MRLRTVFSLLAIGLICAVAVWSQIDRKSSPNTIRVQEINRGVGEKSSTSQPGKTSSDQSEYNTFHKRVTSLRGAKDLYGLLQLQQEIESEWGKTQPLDPYGRSLYASLMIDICGGFNSQDFDNDEQYVLARRCAKTALKNRLSMTVLQEAELVGFLSGTTEYIVGIVQQKEWEKDRKERAKNWLLTWQRLEAEIDPHYDFTANRPVNRVNAPPEEKARAQFHTKQRQLQSLMKSFSSQFTDFLVGAYLTSPSKNEELENLLREYVTDQNVKDSILIKVKSNAVK